MSNLDRTPSLTHCGDGSVATRPVHERFAGREVDLGESTVVRRLLPNLGRRLVGPWCFIDHYGPDDILTQPGMQVPPHPHMGLQTVSWLRAGEIHHQDSLGSDVTIRPGELGLMTAGHGIAHAEHSPGVLAESARFPADFVGRGSPSPHPALLHGAQLWVALPSTALSLAPSWEHHTELPVLHDSGVQATVILGSMGGETSPGTTHSPLVGVSVTLSTGSSTVLPLEPDFEHAVLVLAGSAAVDNERLDVGTMLYLGCDRRDLRLSSTGGAELLVLGGEPFGEQIVMWWNFVGRSNEDIVDARRKWQAGERFGSVREAGERLPAPPLPPGTLKPGGATR
jgi:redox-sensitive bicupin YhaK (pirin superfamily)